MKTINMKQCLLALVLTCSSGWTGAATYVYDNLNRLQSVTYSSGGSITYAYDAAGNRQSQTTVSGVAIAPTVSTGAASGIAATGATLNGNVNANGASTAVSFDYGTTTAYGASIAASPATVAADAGSTPVALAISGLTCGTTYHFRIKGVNSAGTANGSDQTFNTAACIVTAPTAATTSATGVATTSATLNGNVNANGASTAVSFDYGTTAAYGTSIAASPATVAPSAGSTVAATLSSLTCNTTYRFRVKGVNSAGTSYGSDQSFRTSACPVIVPNAPVLTNATPGNGRAILSFTPANDGGIATSYTASCSASGYPTRTASGAGSPIMLGLTGGVTYSCSVVANNSAGSSAPSAAMSVTPIPSTGTGILPMLM